MGFLSVIRRWALREEMPIREIARRTGLSRNTIKKYLREGAVEPKFKTPTPCQELPPKWKEVMLLTVTFILFNHLNNAFRM